jgi:hypothetical protein
MIVGNRNHQIEPLDPRIANGVEVIGMAHEDKVISWDLSQPVGVVSKPVLHF